MVVKKFNLEGEFCAYIIRIINGDLFIS